MYASRQAMVKIGPISVIPSKMDFWIAGLHQKVRKIFVYRVFASSLSFCADFGFQCFGERVHKLLCKRAGLGICDSLAGLGLAAQFARAALAALDHLR